MSISRAADVATGAAPTGSHMSFVCDVCDEHVSPPDGILQFYNANPELGPVGGYPIQPSDDDLQWPEDRSDFDENNGGRGLKVIHQRELLAAVEPPLNVGIMVCHRRCDPHGDDPYYIDLDRITSAEDALDWAHHLLGKNWVGKRDIEHFLEKCLKALNRGS